MLRLLAPDEAGTAQVHVLGPDGEVSFPGGTDVALDAGAVIDLPLGGLPEGSYTVVVDADVPVLAGAMITRGVDVGAATRDPDLPLERAWAASVQPGTAGPLALPGLATWHLVIAVPDAAPGTDAPDGPADVNVELVGADGSVTTGTPVAAGTSITVGLKDLGEAPGTVSGLVVRTDDPRVVWAVVLDVTRRRPATWSACSARWRRPPVTTRSTSGSALPRRDVSHRARRVAWQAPPARRLAG